MAGHPGLDRAIYFVHPDVWRTVLLSSDNYSFPVRRKCGVMDVLLRLTNGAEIGALSVSPYELLEPIGRGSLTIGKRAIQGNCRGVAILSDGQQIEVDEPFIAYITRGRGTANNKQVEDGDLMRGESIKFTATDDVQLLIIHVGE